MTLIYDCLLNISHANRQRRMKRWIELRKQPLKKAEMHVGVQGIGTSPKELAFPRSSRCNAHGCLC